MPELLIAMMIWVTSVVGLPTPQEEDGTYLLPAVVWMSQERLTCGFYKISPEDCTPERLRRILWKPGAAYSPSDKTIILVTKVDLRTDYGQAALLHEIVHHMQNMNKEEFACRKAGEALAYEVQMLWLVKRGHDPYKFLRMSKAQMDYLTTCPSEE